METQPMNELDQTDFTELELCYDDQCLVVLCYDYLAETQQVEISKKGSVVYFDTNNELISLDLERRTTSSEDETIQKLVQNL